MQGFQIYEVNSKHIKLFATLLVINEGGGKSGRHLQDFMVKNNK